jgi:hypothetical protein
MIHSAASEEGTVELVSYNGMDLPWYNAAQLRSLPRDTLRQHAQRLYDTLGSAKIGVPVPTSQMEMVAWTTTVQKLHLQPHRAKTALDQSSKSCSGLQSISLHKDRQSPIQRLWRELMPQSPGLQDHIRQEQDHTQFTEKSVYAIYKSSSHEAAEDTDASASTKLDIEVESAFFCLSPQASVQALSNNSHHNVLEVPVTIIQEQVAPVKDVEENLLVQFPTVVKEMPRRPSKKPSKPKPQKKPADAVREELIEIPELQYTDLLCGASQQQSTSVLPVKETQNVQRQVLVQEPLCDASDVDMSALAPQFADVLPADVKVMLQDSGIFQKAKKEDVANQTPTQEKPVHYLPTQRSNAEMHMEISRGAPNADMELPGPISQDGFREKHMQSKDEVRRFDQTTDVAQAEDQPIMVPDLSVSKQLAKRITEYVDKVILKPEVEHITLEEAAIDSRMLVSGAPVGLFSDVPKVEIRAQERILEVPTVLDVEDEMDLPALIPIGAVQEAASLEVQEVDCVHNYQELWSRACDSSEANTSQFDKKSSLPGATFPDAQALPQSIRAAINSKVLIARAVTDLPAAAEGERIFLQRSVTPPRVVTSTPSNSREICKASSLTSANSIGMENGQNTSSALARHGAKSTTAALTKKSADPSMRATRPSHIASAARMSNPSPQALHIGAGKTMIGPGISAPSSNVRSSKPSGMTPLQASSTSSFTGVPSNLGSGASIARSSSIAVPATGPSVPKLTVSPTLASSSALRLPSSSSFTTCR